MDAEGVLTGAAWREACERLAAMGEEILGDGWPDDEQGRIDGARHLATQVACWFTYATGYSDPTRPAFFRSADPTYAWGGPNVDQVARRATVDGAGAYRVSGRMGSCEEFILQIKGGAVQSGGAEIATEVSASALGLGWILFHGAPWALDDTVARHPALLAALGSTPYLAAINAFVNIHHYFMDHVIWRRENPRTRYLMR